MLKRWECICVRLSQKTIYLPYSCNNFFDDIRLDRVDHVAITMRTSLLISGFLLILLAGGFKKAYAQQRPRPEAILQAWSSEQHQRMAHLDSATVYTRTRITIDSPRGIFTLSVRHQAHVRYMSGHRPPFRWEHRVLEVRGEPMHENITRIFRRMRTWKLGQHLLQQLFFPVQAVTMLATTHTLVADTLEHTPSWRLELTSPPDTPPRRVPFQRFTIWVTQSSPYRLLQARILLHPPSPSFQLVSARVSFTRKQGIDTPEHIQLESIRTHKRRIRTYTYITTLDMTISKHQFFLRR